MISFEYPWLFLLFFVPVLARFFFHLKTQKNQDALKVPFIKDFKLIEQKTNHFIRAQSFPLSARFLFWLFVWFFLILALMRPI